MYRAAVILLVGTIMSTVGAAEPPSLTTMHIGTFRKGGGPGSYAFFLRNQSKTVEENSKDAAGVVKYFESIKEPAQAFALINSSGGFADECEKTDLRKIIKVLRDRQISFVVMRQGAYQLLPREKVESALCLMRDARPRSDTPEYHYYLGYEYLGAGEDGAKKLLAEAPKQGVKQLFVACDSRFDPQAVVRMCKERHSTLFPYGKVSPISPAEEWIFRNDNYATGDVDDDYEIGSPYQDPFK